MPHDNAPPPGRPLLAIAHPGHELRVLHWCEIARPDVAVLTDGSGHGGESRVYRTKQWVEQNGGRMTGFCAPLTDRQLYEAVLGGDLTLLKTTTESLAEVIAAGGYDYVVGDAPEGAIMGHDVFRAVLDAALILARRATGRPLASYDFPLEATPGSVRPELADRACFIHLDDAAVDRKIEVGMAYEEIRGEVVRAVETYGREAFAVECLRPSLTESGLAAFEGAADYERHGEQQVARGRYTEVVRHAEHVAPLTAGLRQWAGGARLQPVR
ncbi:hypothetical protein Pla123a_14190 [Posidoniimonas polymericola]|uniref:Uncharacterized protein n=1 Tax=Posidoniimonas polymericola TaxID=2528002 RepID=A0A5C5YS15_9BACT|nr:hypothetical protein [Posidoniimonas polymericola]TWT77623.1 hypothetical protein Pla123a_14190 [Posidoniimonas polymericola]